LCGQQGQRSWHQSCHRSHTTCQVCICYRKSARRDMSCYAHFFQPGKVLRDTPLGAKSCQTWQGGQFCGCHTLQSRLYVYCFQRQPV
jgi:hypothetical protein